MTSKFSNLWKEQYSLAHLRSVASQAGLTFDVTAVDIAGVDGRIAMPTRNRNGYFEPVVSVQMKSTQVLRRDAAGVPRFDLDVRTYDILRDPTRLIPAILIVVELPTDQAAWIHYGADSICLSHRAHWTKMRGLGDVTNTSTVAVGLPELLDADGLWDLLDSVDRSGDFS